MWAVHWHEWPRTYALSAVCQILGNARSTGGPGILPETNRRHWLCRLNTNNPIIPARLRAQYA
jgi:hypothetical protein